MHITRNRHILLLRVKLSRVAEVRPHQLKHWVHGRDIAHQRDDEGLLAGMPHQVVGHHLMIHCIANHTSATHTTQQRGLEVLHCEIMNIRVMLEIL